MNEEKENQENEIAAGCFVSPVYKVIAVPVEKVVALHIGDTEIPLP